MSIAGNKLRRRARNGKGFTLVEILLVMAIIAIATALIVPAMGRMLLPRLTPKAADQLALAIAHARDEAIRKHKTFRGFLVPDHEDAWVDSENNSLLRLPREVRIRHAGNESAEPMPCTFRADGSGCGLTAHVAEENREWLLQVDPVTGCVRLARVSAQNEF